MTTPPMSHEVAAAYAAQEVAAYAFLRAWLADDVDKGILMLDQNGVDRQEARFFVLAVVKAANRALMAANGYNVEKVLSVIDQWLDDAGSRASL
jgi:hypothetical protein